jgi:hypothetical protein
VRPVVKHRFASLVTQQLRCLANLYASLVNLAAIAVLFGLSVRLADLLMLFVKESYYTGINYTIAILVEKLSVSLVKSLQLNRANRYAMIHV